jgi:hypothetical protein
VVEPHWEKLRKKKLSDAFPDGWRDPDSSESGEEMPFRKK